jgi:DNA-binding XRE family transcriptional regulator
VTIVSLEISGVIEVSSSTIERHHLLSAIPQDWETKFKDELAQSPLLKLVAIKVSQHCIEAYRQSVESLLKRGELEVRAIRSPYLKIKTTKRNGITVTLNISEDVRHQRSRILEKEVENAVNALNFWESSASYMWFDLIRMAFGEMERELGSSTLEEIGIGRGLETLYQYIFDHASDTLKSNFSTVLQTYVEQAVQIVLNQYDLPSKTIQDLEALAGLASTSNLTVPKSNPKLFNHLNTNNFATCKLLWESVNILTQRTDLKWEADSDGKLSYTSKFKDDKGSLIFWVTDEPDEQYPEALAGEAALAVIETFDIRAACMHLIYAAHVTTLERPWEEEFVIDDRQIASYLGLDKRKDLSREQRLKLIEHISEQPAQILTFLHWPKQGNIESFYVEKSRLWEIAIGYHGQHDLFGKAECTGLTIRCRAGMWAKYFLNRRGAEEGNAFYQYGVLSKTLLQTITRVWQHSEGAARMLAWLSFKMRVSTHNIMLTTTLMDVAYGHDRVECAHHDRTVRSELASTWDNDLRILSEAGFVIEFDANTYPSDIQPDWKEGGRGSQKRPRGFWEMLSNSRLYIHPPQEIADGIAKLHRRKQTNLESSSTRPSSTPRRKPTVAVSGSMIKTAREAKGWTQEELGQQLGRTKMWVSLLEREKRSLKPEDATQIQALLDL